MDDVCEMSERVDDDIVDTDSTDDANDESP